MNFSRRLLQTLLCLLTLFFWVSALWQRMELIALNRAIRAEETELSELKAEEQLLQTRLHQPLELEERERQALSLGMSKPRAEQLLPAAAEREDVVTVLEPRSAAEEKLRSLLRKLRSCFPS